LFILKKRNRNIFWQPGASAFRGSKLHSLLICIIVCTVVYLHNCTTITTVNHSKFGCSAQTRFLKANLPASCMICPSGYTHDCETVEAWDFADLPVVYGFLFMPCMSQEVSISPLNSFYLQISIMFCDQLGKSWCKISNKRKSVSSGYPNPEKWVEKTRRSRVFLTNFEVFGYLMKHSSFWYGFSNHL